MSRCAIAAAVLLTAAQFQFAGAQAPTQPGGLALEAATPTPAGSRAANKWSAANTDDAPLRHASRVFELPPPADVENAAVPVITALALSPDGRRIAFSAEAVGPE